MDNKRLKIGTKVKITLPGIAPEFSGGIIIDYIRYEESPLDFRYVIENSWGCFTISEDAEEWIKEDE